MTPELASRAPSIRLAVREFFPSQARVRVNYSVRARVRVRVRCRDIRADRPTQPAARVVPGMIIDIISGILIGFGKVG